LQVEVYEPDAQKNFRRLRKMVILKKINLTLIRISEVLSIVLLSSMVITILLQVFYRYVLSDALSWTEEISRYLMIWMALIASYIGVAAKRHISLSILEEKLQNKMKILLRIISKLVVLFFVCFTAIFGFKLALAARVGLANSVDISMIYIYISIPVCFLLMAFNIFIEIIEEIKMFK
jgi:TRAP-type C4-dicarboxylate transport system permease small subunit